MLAAVGDSSLLVTRLLLLLQAQGSGKDALDKSGLQDQFSGGQRMCLLSHRSSSKVWLAHISPATHSCANSARARTRHPSNALPAHQPACLQPCAPAPLDALPAAAPPTWSSHCSRKEEQEE
jgi:hypothetical protein